MLCDREHQLIQLVFLRALKTKIIFVEMDEHRDQRRPLISVNERMVAALSAFAEATADKPNCEPRLANRAYAQPLVVPQFAHL